MADTHARSRSRRNARSAPPPPPARQGPGFAERILTAAPWKLALGFALLHLVFAFLAFNPTPYIGGDNATYMALAQSLAEKHRYLELWDPAMKPHTQYPPLWPAFLALLWMVGLRGWIVMKVVVLLCSVAAVGLSYLWLRRTSTPGLAFGAALVLAVAPGILDLSHWELSDQPAWVLVMLAFWASTHLIGTREREGDGGDGEVRRHGLWLAVMTAAVVANNFVRAAGLPLVVAAVAWLALRRRWKDLAVLVAVFLPPAILWWLWGKTNGGVSYASFLWNVDPYMPAAGQITPLGMLERMYTNAGRYISIHEPVVLFWDPRIATIVTLPFTLLAIGGWARRLKRPGLMEMWVPLYIGLLLVWPPTWSGERFLLPLMAPMLCYAGEALRDIFARFRMPSMARLVPASACALLLVLAAPGVGGVMAFGRECSAQYRAGETLPCMNQEFHDFMRLAEMTRGRLPPGSVALSRKATLWYALSGYPSRTYPLSADPENFFRFAREAGARYVVFDNIRDLSPLYLQPIVFGHREEFCVMLPLNLPAAALLKLERGPPPPPNAPPTSMRECPLR